MCAKIGRPKLDDPKSIKLAIKLNKETLAKINEIAEANSLTKGQVVRQSVEFLYRHIKNRRFDCCPQNYCQTFYKNQKE